MNFRKVNFERAILCGVDFTGANLEGARISGANLSGANLGRANLRGTICVGATFKGARFTDADATGGDFHQANMFQVKIHRSSFAQANMENVNLHAAEVRESGFGRAKLTGADIALAKFESSDLEGAEMDRSCLTGTSIRSTSMKGVTLRRAILQEMELDGLNLDGADFYRARMAGVIIKKVNLKGAILDSADFKDARLCAVALKDAQVVGTRFVGAWLESVNFQGSLMKSADFTGAQIEDCNFSGIDPSELATCTGLDIGSLLPENLDGSRDESTPAPVHVGAPDPGSGSMAAGPAAPMARAVPAPSLATATAKMAPMAAPGGGLRTDRVPPLALWAPAVAPPARASAEYQSPDETVILTGDVLKELVLALECQVLEASDLARLVLALEELHDQILCSSRGMARSDVQAPEDRLRIVRARVGEPTEFRFRGAVLSAAGKAGPGPAVLEVVRELFGGGLLEVALKIARAGGPAAGSEGIPPAMSPAREEALRELRGEIHSRASRLLPSVPGEDVDRVAALAFRLPMEVARSPSLRQLAIY